MAGAYCRYCSRRCFALRVIDHGPHQWSGHMATCERGAEHDRSVLGGFDHTTARNFIIQPDPPRLLTDGPEPAQLTIVRTDYGAGPAWVRLPASDPRADGGLAGRCPWLCLATGTTRAWASLAQDNPVAVVEAPAVPTPTPDGSDPVVSALRALCQHLTAAADGLADTDFPDAAKSLFRAGDAAEDLARLAEAGR